MNSDQTTDTTQKSKTHVFKMLNTTSTICGENCESSRVQVSLYTKKHKCIMWSMWVITAWQCISLEVTVKGFKKCCVSNEMDETNDDLLWNASEEDGDLRNECEDISQMALPAILSACFGPSNLKSTKA
jgi:hypothetical protein